MIGLWTGNDLDSATHQPEGAELRLALLVGISRALKRGGNFPGVCFVAIVYGSRDGVNLRGIAEDRTSEALRNNAVVLDVEIAEGRTQASRRYQK